MVSNWSQESKNRIEKELFEFIDRAGDSTSPPRKSSLKTTLSECTLKKFCTNRKVQIISKASWQSSEFQKSENNTNNETIILQKSKRGLQ